MRHWIIGVLTCQTTKNHSRIGSLSFHGGGHIPPIFVTWFAHVASIY